MQSNKPRYLAFFGTCLLTGLAQPAWSIAVGGPPPAPPMPEDGNVYFGYLEDQELFDSNIFRVPNSGSVPLGASKSDEVNNVVIGGMGQWYLGRQMFLGKVDINHSFYAHNNQLDNTGGDASLLWNWLVGPYFSGQLGAEYQHSLASFQETLYTGRDLVDSQIYFGTGKYQIGPHWAIEGGIHESRYTHTADAARSSNLRVTLGNAGIEFDYNLANSFTLEYLYADGKYPSGVFDTLGTTAFSPNYHDSQPRLDFKYVISDKTSVSGYGGYLTRTYENTEVGAFSGVVGRIEGLWQVTDKTQVNVAAWHELHAYLASQANYFVSKGVSVAPVWKVTDKLSGYLTLSYENQDYIPSSQNAIVFGQMITAKSANGVLSAVYRPLEALELNFLYQRSQRSSNTDAFRFSDNLAYVSASFKFR